MAKPLEETTISKSPLLNQKVKSAASANTVTLLEVVQKLSLAKDLETIMFIVRKAARNLTGADGATFVLRDGDQCHYADEDAIAPLWKGKRFPMNLCISGWVMLNRQPAIIPDIYADRRIPADAYRPTFVKSLVMVPIRTQSPIGAIGTYWADYHTPTDEQVNMLKALADSTSVAMENIQLQSELQRGLKKTSAQTEATKQLMEVNKNLQITLAELHRRTEEMQWIKELSSKLQTCLYIEEAYKLVKQYAQHLLPNVAGNLYLMHPSRNYLECMISWGDPLADEKIIKPEECLALRSGSTYKVDDTKDAFICAHSQTTPLAKSYTCIPLFAQSDIIGLMYLEWKNYDTYNAIEIDKKNNQDVLASTVAEQVTLGISNIKLRETLRNQSFRDALTGLYNRRYLEETLEREIIRCERKSTPLAVLMIDIDHFKQFNDNFGHEAGDMVMQALARELRNIARKDDIVCRYGGEEFIIVMPEVDSETVANRTKALHEAVSHIHLRYGDKALTQVTISIGVAIYPHHGKNMRDLIAASDVALYEAKNSGRNKTVIFKMNAQL